MKDSFSPLYELDSQGSTVSLKKFGPQQVSFEDEVHINQSLASNMQMPQQFSKC